MNTDQLQKLAPRTGTGIFLAIVVVAFVTVLLNAFPMIRNYYFLYMELIRMTLVGFVYQLRPVQAIVMGGSGAAMVILCCWLSWLAARDKQQRIFYYVTAVASFYFGISLLHYAKLFWATL